MSPQELAGFGSAINEAIVQACAAVRAEHAQALADIRREADGFSRSMEQRCERAEGRVEQLQRGLDATRELAAQPAISAALMDADGALHVVLRSGEKLMVPLADFAALVAAAVSDSLGEAELRLGGRLDGQVARAMQRLGDAPKWTRTAVYGEGAVVSCYVGRTYALHDGIKASMGQEPGEHPEVWQRIGSHGLRVMKSKPTHLEAGDVFSDTESRFIHDGETTTLFVPRALKQSDIDRVVKPAHALAHSAMEHASNAERRIDAVESNLGRIGRAANDAQAWIETEGDAAVLRSAETQAWCTNRSTFIDSPALMRIVERADEIDSLLDQEVRP